MNQRYEALMGFPVCENPFGFRLQETFGNNSPKVGNIPTHPEIVTRNPLNR